MPGNQTQPTYESVMSDLALLREKGVGRVRGLSLPALDRVVALVDPSTGKQTDPTAITAVLRSAVDTLGGGSLQDAAEVLLGLSQGTALWSGAMRRDQAAEHFGVVRETFRKKPEKELLGLIAEAILSACHDARLRVVRADMEQQRHPADSRLAVQWVERFEAYYRIWTPAYALGAELEGALDTYLEEPSDHLPWDPDSSDPYDPVRQAQGYGHSALYWLAQFHLEVKRFKSKHGGLWLLSDMETEKAVADAVYRIGWHNNLSDGDESFLRRHLADSRHEEAEHFWRVIQAFPDGARINDLWQHMIFEGVGLTTQDEKARSQVWQTIQACRDYCDMVDADWLKIADWYRPGSSPGRDRVTGAKLYRRHLGEEQA
jgi:hypothetical protein